MRVLVTGATGFLGGGVARRLHEKGHTVLATGRDRALGAALAAQGLTFQAADLTVREDVRELCEAQDCVVHCAALSSPWGAYEQFFRANVVATGHVVAAATQARVQRLVHISTPSIYMGMGSRTGVREDDPLPAPINAYAATKLRAEDIVKAAARVGLTTLMLRPRALFGPGDTTIFPRLLRALRSGRLPIIGDGQNWVDLTYIDNVVDAVELACEAGPKAHGGIYNITNGEPVQLWQVVGELARALDIPEPRRKVPRALAMVVARAAELAAQLKPGSQEPMLTRYGVSVLADTMTLDISRARALLGYAPRVSVREGIERFVRSMKEPA